MSDFNISVAPKLLLKGARVFDPSVKLDRAADLFVADGVLQKIGRFDQDASDILVINAKGKTVIPGLFDMHVHLREPGREDEETVASGCRAAAAGGFTEMACMPNTQPPVDNRSQVEFILDRASGQPVRVHPVACITRGQHGEELTEMGELVRAGAAAFSDDGKPVEKAVLLRRALEYAGMFGKPVIEHCEDRSLSENGVMHEGWVSTSLGLRGIPSIAEEVMVARDLLVAEYTGGMLHIAHVSTQGSVRLIREAKSRGVRVTAETCPHYLVLTDEAVRQYDTQAKMNPPLRSESDRREVIAGLKDGTIDAVATDHAPHAVHEKDVEFDAAPFGILGLETAVGLMWTELVRTKTLSLEDVVRLMSAAPRKILGLPGVQISEGSQANWTLIDSDLEWTVDADRFQSQSRNTPFHGRKCTGASVGIVRQTYVVQSSGG
jgi:dihydroorotase